MELIGLCYDGTLMHLMPEPSINLLALDNLSDNSNLEMNSGNLPSNRLF